MQTKIWIATLITSLTLATSANAQSCLDEAKAAHPDAPATQALFCVEQMQSSLEAANRELETLNHLLKSAVLAFNRSERDGACPAGWSLFDPAGGRMIVGAGSHNNAGASEYESFADDQNQSTGGQENVTLTDAQMPGHKHGAGSMSVPAIGNTIHMTADGVTVSGNLRVKNALFGPVSGRRNFGSHAHTITGMTDTVGASQPHNNMPPYIALYFCQKD